MVDHVRIIGITGGIGAGKSVVSRILRCRGFEVYDCDLEAKRIMDSSATLKKQLRSRLGKSCVSDTGVINRSEIAGIIFADESCRAWLNSRVHSMVCGDVLEKARSTVDGLLFVESAIMRTSKLTDLCSAIILVDAPVETRVRRAAGRDSVSAESVRRRIEAQKEEYGKFGDLPLFVILNSDGDPIMRQVDNCLESLELKI